jgi:hypothetical protein
MIYNITISHSQSAFLFFSTPILQREQKKMMMMMMVNSIWDEIKGKKSFFKCNLFCIEILSDLHG